jgi:hypothetical protein
MSLDCETAFLPECETLFSYMAYGNQEQDFGLFVNRVIVKPRKTFLQY